MKVTILGLIETFVIMIIGIVTWTLVSCITTSPIFIENELLLYKNEFISKTKYEESDFDLFSIKFMSLPKRTVGLCNFVTREIFIDPVYWYNSNKLMKKILMFHEFGHCICHKRHNNKQREDKCPVSIMNKTLPDSTCLKKHWDSYMDKFLERCDS